MNKFLIGVPKEVKPQEGRVGVTPDGVRAIVACGACVGVERGAGILSGFSDDDYVSAGALMYRDVEGIYRDADMIIKVKEPTPEEYWLLQLLRGKTLFTFLHLAGVDPELTKQLLRYKIAAIAYETVASECDGRTLFPILVPMSRIAGMQAMRGALLRHKKEKYGELNVVIVGGGVVGEAALNQALANNVGTVSLFELRDQRAKELREKYADEKNFRVYPFSFLEDQFGGEVLWTADIVVSGVMLPGGAAAPHVLTAKHFALMKRGAYIADVAIDQGGSTEWSRVTKPGETFTAGEQQLVFSCVPNIPGSTVPGEATEALTKETLPFIHLLAKSMCQHGSQGIYWTLKDNLSLRAGLQTYEGFLTNRAVAEKFGMTGYESYKSFEAIFC